MFVSFCTLSPMTCLLFKKNNKQTNTKKLAVFKGKTSIQGREKNTMYANQCGDKYVKLLGIPILSCNYACI